MLYKDTGRILEYRHLRRDPKYKDTWNIYAAYEFRQLSQKVGSRVKGTDTIYILHKMDVTQDRLKEVTYRNSSVMSSPPMWSQIGRDLLLG